tara:strand:- start:1136 stop:1609 length:474 start_codon:yes stop_codon:yes gene_type:complete
MKTSTLLIALFSLIPFQANALEEDAFEKAKKHHQTIINACEAKAQPKWDTGTTAEMMDGSYLYVECLYGEIKRISDVYFISPNKNINKDAFLKQLKIHTESAYETYWLLYHGACSPCGTMYRGMHINDTAGEIKNILKTMLNNAYEHGRPLQEPDNP